MKQNKFLSKLITLAIALTMCLVIVPTVSADCPTEMVAYWKLDEGIGSTASDETTNANDGILSGGKFGNALEFVGVDDYVVVGDVLDNIFAGSDKTFTVELWTKINSFPDGTPGKTVSSLIIGKLGDSAIGPEDQREFGVILRPDGSLDFGWSNLIGYWRIVRASTPLTTGTWYHIAVEYDGSIDTNDGLDRVSIYINGISQSTFMAAALGSLSDIQDGNAKLALGAAVASNDDHGYWFDGLVDEVRISDNLRYGGGFTPQISAFTSDGNTVALWHVDESVGTDVYDETTNANDGTNNGATWAGPTWTTGQVGDALSFDGVDDYVEVPDSSSLDITTAITIEAWFYNYGNIDPAMRWQRIIHKNYRKNYEMWIDSSTRLLEFRIGSGVGTTQDTLASGTTIQFNEWYHVAAVYDGSNMYLYLNGVLSNSKSTSIPSLGITADPVIIGNVGNDISAFNYNRPFNGKIDEVALYNTDLSADEISYHYCLGHNFGHGYYDPPSLTYTGGQLFSNTDDFVLKATLKDSDGNGISGKIVEFFDNAGTLGTATTDGNGIASITLSPKPADVYEIYAKAYCLESDHVFIAVYDPTAGFVTGGGWIMSPEGAYKPDPDLTGKANFGFVSKYKKGQSIPTGNTEFQFKAGDLNFHSSSYEWLVITGGNKAMYKGTGTINDAGSYKFMLTAYDDDTDTFRIRIWYEDGENEIDVYDNEGGTALGGGQIKIHSGQ